MVATKRCAWGTCRNDSRYPHRITKNEKGDEVRFYRFLHLKDGKHQQKKGNAGLQHVIVAIPLYVEKTATFAVSIS